MSNTYIRGSTRAGFGAGMGCVFGILFAIALICGGIGLFLYIGVNGARELKQSNTESVKAVGEWSQVGDARVSVISASIADPVVLDLGNNESPLGEQVLVIRVRIENTSTTKRVDHLALSSNDARFDDTKLVDEHGNHYFRKATHRPPKGAVRFIETLDPGSPPIRDIVCFEPPIKAASVLRLTLVAADGKHEFLINKNDWLSK